MFNSEQKHQEHNKKIVTDLRNLVETSAEYYGDKVLYQYKRYKEEHKFTIHHSTDGGDTWSILYQADLLGVGGIIDIEQYDDILILYTYTDGIYIYRIK